MNKFKDFLKNQQNMIDCQQNQDHDEQDFQSFIVVKNVTQRELDTYKTNNIQSQFSALLYTKVQSNPNIQYSSNNTNTNIGYSNKHPIVQFKRKFENTNKLQVKKAFKMLKISDRSIDSSKQDQLISDQQYSPEPHYHTNSQNIAKKTNNLKSSQIIKGLNNFINQNQMKSNSNQDKLKYKNIQNSLYNSSTNSIMNQKFEQSKYKSIHDNMNELKMKMKKLNLPQLNRLVHHKKKDIVKVGNINGVEVGNINGVEVGNRNTGYLKKIGLKVNNGGYLSSRIQR